MNAWPLNLLKHRAEEIAAKLTGGIPVLEKYVDEMTMDLELARNATARAEAFPTSGDLSYCPACWMNSAGGTGTAAILFSIESDKPRTDSFKCNRCRKTFDFQH